MATQGPEPQQGPHVPPWEEHPDHADDADAKANGDNEHDRPGADANVQRSRNGTRSTAKLQTNFVKLSGSLSSPDSPASPILPSRLLSNAGLLPGQPRSLSAISLRAFLLGLTLGLAALITVLLSAVSPHHHPIWRASFFLSSLSLFHFLEFHITARYNTPFADVAAFLLSRNGAAYNIAHSAAMIECILTTFVFPSWQARFSTKGSLFVGVAMIAVGQVTRTAAMIHAATNFNHTVQVRKARGHKLVTTGPYALLRHPSYFGFFWWALGTQVICGNVVCLLAYTVVLWKFFSSRIRKEEEFLLDFFGKDYLDYRARTIVGIPFVP